LKKNNLSQLDAGNSAFFACCVSLWFGFVRRPDADTY
jgi:hypothetical protein